MPSSRAQQSAKHVGETNASRAVMLVATRSDGPSACHVLHARASRAHQSALLATDGSTAHTDCLCVVRVVVTRAAHVGVMRYSYR